ncbi:sortase-dependent protein, partial [Streptomyces sp. NPDC055058]
MRRTLLSAAALACTAVLAGTAPASADGPAPAVPVSDAAPTPVPTEAPATEPSPVPAESDAPAPAEEATGVSVVPSGAPDTGAAATSSGPDG